MFHRGLKFQIRHQPVDELGKNLRVVPKSQRNDSFVLSRRVVDDIGEVAVQREQNRVNFLSLGQDHGVDESTGKTSLKRETSLVASLNI